MTDTVDSQTRSRIMARVRSKDTKPELSVRRALHAAGFRFRLQARGLPGKPDLVLPSYRTAVFVNGCFWHWHGCKRSRMPSSNAAYWNAKISRNIVRDKATQAALKGLGWRCVVIWECEIVQGSKRLIRVLQRIKRINENRRIPYVPKSIETLCSNSLEKRAK